MAFIFSTSHLPESLVRRPDRLEDEEEDDVMQPMPRAGGVRAFSHLPVRDNPAASTGPLRADSPRVGPAPIPPRSATPVGRPRPYVAPEADIKTDDDQDTFHAPVPDSDHDDATRSHEYQDDSPWYMPRITAQDLPPQAHDEDVGRSSLNRPVRDSGFDDAHSAERSTSTTRDNGFSPSPQDLRDAFHSPTGEASAQDNSPTLPRGRIFEKRLPPGLRGQSSGQFQSLADKPEYHDLVYRSSSQEDE
ncbi:MAG: hypothetical protein B7Z37_23190 [Verrucomicrobia bacterium 12-59-8]|nr:MAG: hypothetical protein B7Z37_23190 [Verrucomicrobia bacterium 12-59-8]